LFPICTTIAGYPFIGLKQKNTVVCPECKMYVTGKDATFFGITNENRIFSFAFFCFP